MIPSVFCLLLVQQHIAHHVDTIKLCLMQYSMDYETDFKGCKIEELFKQKLIEHSCELTCIIFVECDLTAAKNIFITNVQKG